RTWARLRSGRSVRKEKTRRRNSTDRAGQSARSRIETLASASTISSQAADHLYHCCLRLLFAYQTKQQAGFFLKDLVPLAAIGRAYVWRAAPGSASGEASSGLVQSAACVRLVGIHNGTDRRAKSIRLRTRLRRDTEEQ